MRSRPVSARADSAARISSNDRSRGLAHVEKSLHHSDVRTSDAFGPRPWRLAGAASRRTDLLPLAGSVVIVDAVIPALNEAGSVGGVVAGLPRSLIRSVIVADNGSTDGTGDVARAAGAIVVREERRGYGAACLCAMAALPPDGDVVLFLDADGSDDVGALAALLDPLARGTADFVVGSRVRGGGQAALTFPQRMGNALAARWLRVRYGIPATDLGPFRAIRRDALAALDMQDRTYGWTVEMQIKAARAGLRYAEVSVQALPRRAGRSKVSGTLRGVAGAAWKIIGLLVRYDLCAKKPARRASHGADE